jgi:ferrous iron transport protein B
LQHISSIALVGNPNTGKSTLFNALTGLRQKIANYPGVTVEQKTGYTTINGNKIRLTDLPGIYSLNPQQPDEQIAYDVLTGQYEHEPAPDLAIVVADASNLSRNLYLATQVSDLGIPVLVVLSMIDLAREKGLEVDAGHISSMLGVPVIPVVAKDAGQAEKLRLYLETHDIPVPDSLSWNPGPALEKAVETIIKEWVIPYSQTPARAQYIEALRFLSSDHAINAIPDLKQQHKLRSLVENARRDLEAAGKNYLAEEVMRRYDFIERCTSRSVKTTPESNNSRSDKIDAYLTHHLMGPLFFGGLLLLMFQAVFSWAAPFMDLIDLMFVETGNALSDMLPAGLLNDLLVEGVVAGLGGVVIFLPQIMFLFFFISILEGSGYMARAAFVMDGLMSKAGLHGRSVVPLMSGFACAIPGIMATRTIDNWRDRLITIMVLPFMACSARLPVYALLIAAFVPDTPVVGFINVQGITFFGLYIFGIVMALLSALVMKQLFHSGQSSAFIMELPGYKMPKWSSVFHTVFERGKIFVWEAGRIIVAISIVLWFLASFPQKDFGDIPAGFRAAETVETTGNAEVSEEQRLASYQLRESYAGRFGRFIEPVIEPLGFDWKIGIGLITSFAAREVMVGTLNTIYSVQDESGESLTLQQKLRRDTDPDTGEPLYNFWTALSLMVFFALAMQCMSTIAIVRRETNSWKWPVIMFSYMTILAYLCSLAVYQGGIYFF